MRRFFYRELRYLNPILRVWRFMRPYLRSSAPTALFFLFIAIHIIVWWKGPDLVIEKEHPLSSVTSRVLFSIVFTLAALLFISFKMRKEIKNYYNDRKKEELLTVDVKLKYIERQRVELNEMVENLKQNYQENNHLYDIPWYLVVGLSDAGKTSLIKSSGIDFLYKSILDASNFKSENPFSYNWWFSDDALFIDPDSEILVQKPLTVLTPGENDPQLARHLWLDFLDWVSEVRVQRPLNGIVLVVDLPQLVGSLIAERRAHAGILRARIQEVISMVSSQMPIYVVFTKLDQLQGFKEFFKHLNKDERESLFGFTFKIDAVNSINGWLKDFKEQYEEFLAKIKSCLPTAMIESAQQDDRVALYSFYQQLLGIKSILSQFLREVLISDKYSMQPLIRGVYFTSIYQQGVPYNLFLNEIVKRYQLDNYAIRAQDNRYSTPFFTKDLFTKLIIKESGLATDNAKEVKRKRSLFVKIGIASSAIAIILLGFVNYYYFKNLYSLGQVREKVELFVELPGSGQKLDVTGQVMLPELNLIREAMLEMGDFHSLTPFSEMGLNQAKKVGTAIERTYLRLLSYGYVRHLASGVAYKLSLAEPESDEQLRLLRIFHMLTNQKARMPDLVMDYFTNYWQPLFSGQAQVQSNLIRHLDYALKYTDVGQDREDGVIEAEEVLYPYDDLVAKSRIDIRKIPMEQRIYRSFKHYGLVKYNTPLDLRVEVGPAFDIVFAQEVNNEPIPTDIPMIFTKKGIDQYYSTQSDNVYQMAIIDNWIIGEREQLEYTDEDLEWFKTKIREQYTADYIAVWRERLNSLDVRSFNSISDGVLVLDNVLGGNQPFQRLLASVKDNTQLTANLAADQKARLELEKSNTYFLSSEINGDFYKLNKITDSVMQTDTSTIAPLFNTEVMDIIGGVNTLLRNIQDAPNPGQMALLTAKNRIMLNESDPIYALTRVSAQLPSPMNRIVNKLAVESWKVILMAALAEVDKKWNEEVYGEFVSTLAPKYPFNPSAKAEVSLEEFIHFFGENGTITKFYKEDLSPFLGDYLAVDGTSAGEKLIKPEVLEQIRNAEKIRKGFFNQQGVLGIEFMIAPVSMGSQIQRSVLNIEGQYVVFTHGPKHWYALVWPNTLTKSASETVAKLSMTGGKAQSTITTHGPWALFRMFDQGTLTPISGDRLSLTFNPKGVPMRYEINVPGEINPFTTTLLRQFYLSPSLYK